MQPAQALPVKGNSLNEYVKHVDAMIQYADALIGHTQKISDLKSEKKIIEEQRVKLEGKQQASAQKIEALKQKDIVLTLKEDEHKQNLKQLEAEKQRIALKKQALFAALAKKKAEQ